MRLVCLFLLLTNLGCQAQQSPPAIQVEAPGVVSKQLNVADSSNFLIYVLDSGFLLKHLNNIALYSDIKEVEDFISLHKSAIDREKIFVQQSPSAVSRSHFGLLNPVLKKHGYYKFRIVTNDSETPFLLDKKDYDALGQFMWRTLVPPSGQAATVQGELLRAIERLADEAQRNGNINFGTHCHTHLIAYLRKYLTDPAIFDQPVIEQVKKDLKTISDADSPYTEEDLYDRLRERIYEWFLKNVTPKQHTLNPKLKC
jgi:hypothetical protein